MSHHPVFHPGTVIGNRYEIRQRIASGSMGTVYRARHLELNNRIVAVKVLFPQLAHDPVARRRFENEILTMYGIHHPNVVPAYDFVTDDEILAYSMEYLEGGDLLTLVEKEGALPVSKILSLMHEIAAALEEIHGREIIHRDLKPENVLFTAEGVAKVSDFGIARMGSGPRLTAHGSILGAFDYLSPEYLEFGIVDYRSDIYSLGMIGYFIACGELPFQSGTAMESLNMRLKSAPPSLLSIRPELPVALESLILRAIAVDPSERIQTATQFLSELKAADPSPRKEVIVQSVRRHREASDESATEEMLIDQPLPGGQRAVEIMEEKQATEDYGYTFVYGSCLLNNPIRGARCSRARVSLLMVLLILTGSFVLVNWIANAPAGTFIPVKHVVAMSGSRNTPSRVSSALEIDKTIDGLVASASKDKNRKFRGERASLKVRPELPKAVGHFIRFKGETLAIIAEWYTGAYTNWKQIAKANPSLNPNRLEAGDQIMIPAALLVRERPFEEDEISGIIENIKNQRKNRKK